MWCAVYVVEQKNLLKALFWSQVETPMGKSRRNKRQLNKWLHICCLSEKLNRQLRCTLWIAYFLFVSLGWCLPFILSETQKWFPPCCSHLKPLTLPGAIHQLLNSDDLWHLSCPVLLFLTRGELENTRTDILLYQALSHPSRSSKDTFWTREEKWYCN